MSATFKLGIIASFIALATSIPTQQVFAQAVQFLFSPQQGLTVVSERELPCLCKATDSNDGIKIQVQPNSDTFQTPRSINIRKGAVDVEVKAPSKMAVVATPLGRIAVHANSRVSVIVNDNMIVVRHLAGNGTVEMQSYSHFMAALCGDLCLDSTTVEIAQGYDLVASNSVIDRHNLPVALANQQFLTAAAGYALVSKEESISQVVLKDNELPMLAAGAGK